MNHLLRDRAPISDAGWRLIDAEARERLLPAMAARRLVDFRGPLGWEHSATALGRVDAIAGGGKNVVAARRRVLPLVELRVPFSLQREELRSADRGAADPDLEPLDRAAMRIATAENRAVFHGWKEAGIAGIAESSSQDPIPLGEDCERYPRHVAKAVEALLSVGVAGPYGLALGRDAYGRVEEASEHGGFPLLEHLRRILGGPLVWAPGVEGAVVVSLRGGDYLFECGQDISAGYSDHAEESVRLYLEESFSFRVATREAAVALPP